LQIIVVDLETPDSSTTASQSSVVEFAGQGGYLRLLFWQLGKELHKKTRRTPPQA
jgi:hypothetical protein